MLRKNLFGREPHPSILTHDHLSTAGLVDVELKLLPQTGELARFPGPHSIAHSIRALAIITNETLHPQRAANEGTKDKSISN